MNPSMLQKYAGRTVITLGAHPDDVEIGMGGTVARLTSLGARVIVAVACVPSQPEVRVREARISCDLLGASIHLLYEGEEHHVEDVRCHDLVARLDALIKQHAPAALFSHGRSDHHRDHQLVFDAFKASLRLGGMDGYCYQPCSCRPGPLVFTPRAFVDIGATLALKMEAIEAHQSQFRARGLDTEFLRDAARFYGRQAGVTYAEGFEVMLLALG